MIKFTAQNALVHSVSPAIEIPSKSGGQSFFKRELVINDSWEREGRLHTNFVVIEFSGDKMGQLDSIFPGQRVNIEGMICGREYNNRIYNTVRGLSVIPYQAQPQYAPAPAPMPGAYTSQGQYQQAPGYQAAPMPGSYAQQPAPAPAYCQQHQPLQQPAPAPAPSPAATPAPPRQSFDGQHSPGVADLPFSPS